MNDRRERELFDPDASTKVIGGRRYPYASLGHWVLLNPTLKHLEVRLYGLLRMCADNQTELATPGQPYLAELCGLSPKRAEPIIAAVRMLAHLQALDVETVPTVKGRQNIYTVHEAPPEGYEGPTTQLEYGVVTGRRKPPPGYTGPPPGWVWPARPEE